jgi:hypothetical protein
MKIGIDISQIVHEKTGVAKYVQELVRSIVTHDKKNSYILFGASLRKQHILRSFVEKMHTLNPNVSACIIPIPPTLLDILWNQFHIIPIQHFTGAIDIFWSSDWTQAPLGKAQGITTIHDLSFYHFPESFDQTIVSVQKRRLKYAAKECQHFLCDSEATKNDVEKFLKIDSKKLAVVYPGFRS